MKWKKASAAHGLRAGLHIHIGLLTAPVLLRIGAVIRQMTFMGNHPSQEPRVEPVVKAGEILATEVFVAFVKTAWRNGEAIPIHHDYLGSIDFAKSYGRSPRFQSRERLCTPSWV